MITKDTHFRDLFQKYIQNKCTEKELREITEWLATNQAKNEIAGLTRELWENIPLEYSMGSPEKTEELRRESEHLIGKQTEKQKKHTRHIFRPFYRVAAILILILTCASLSFLYRNHQPTGAITYQTIISQQGEIRKIELADGSKVTLNAGSRLYIPEDFNVRQRNVILDGEAFFDVTPNPQKTFNIQGGNTHIQVLGTSFNVKAYEEDQQLAVTVSSGKVKIDLEDMDTHLHLTRNQHLVIDRVSGDFERKTVEENLYVKWMDGILYFENESLDEIARKIQRYYDKEIIVGIHSDNKFSISGTHDNKSLEAVLESVCFIAGVGYEQKEDKIIITD